MSLCVCVRVWESTRNKERGRESVCECKFIYICIFIFVYVCVYIHISLCLSLSFSHPLFLSSLCIPAYTYTCVWNSIYTHMHTYMYLYQNTNMNIYICTVLKHLGLTGISRTEAFAKAQTFRQDNACPFTIKGLFEFLEKSAFRSVCVVDSVARWLLRNCTSATRAADCAAPRKSYGWKGTCAMYVCENTNICVYIYACVYIYICASMYAYIYMCTYVYAYTHILNVIHETVSKL